MPPKKKAKKSAAEEEPLEYIEHVRERATKRFAKSHGKKKKNVNYDIEQNIREIRALLKINDEIFQRCISSGQIISESKSATFTRYSYDVVKVRQNTTNQSQTDCITKPEQSHCNFDVSSLMSLPKGINDLFLVPYQSSYPGLVDYHEFLESALMLHDDILEPFLAKIKGHTETIHVCLGEIESWLLAPKSNIEFIEEIFGMKLEPPTAADIGVKVCDCSAGTHQSTDICECCKKSFGAHTRQLYGGIISKFRCPNSSYHATFFRCKKQITLKTLHESGKFEKTFSISHQNDKDKLTKFLDFMN